MKIGLFGGTFDPPHHGHLALAQTVREALGLDEVLFVPSNQNPLKSRKASATKHRCKMVQLAIEGEPGLAFSDIDVTRHGFSYAVETLEELRLVKPGDYWFLMGADTLREILEWKDPERLIALCRLAVVERRGDEVDTIIRALPTDFKHAIDVVPMPPVAVSSSKIREDVMRDAPVGHWLKPAVWEYIKTVGLYKE